MLHALVLAQATAYVQLAIFVVVFLVGMEAPQIVQFVRLKCIADSIA